MVIMRSDIKNIQQYLSQLPSDQRKELNRLISLTKMKVPEAEESISYGMPAFKYKNKPLIYFGAFKDHLSVFPTSGPIEELEDQLAPYKKAKGTLSYRLDNVIPDELIIKLIETRVRAIENPK